MASVSVGNNEGDFVGTWRTGAIDIAIWHGGDIRETQGNNQSSGRWKQVSPSKIELPYGNGARGYLEMAQGGLSGAYTPNGSNPVGVKRVSDDNMIASQANGHWKDAQGIDVMINGNNAEERSNGKKYIGTVRQTSRSSISINYGHQVGTFLLQPDGSAMYRSSKDGMFVRLNK